MTGKQKTERLTIRTGEMMVQQVNDFQEEYNSTYMRTGGYSVSEITSQSEAYRKLIDWGVYDWYSDAVPDVDEAGGRDEKVSFRAPNWLVSRVKSVREEYNQENTDTEMKSLSKAIRMLVQWGLSDWSDKARNAHGKPVVNESFRCPRCACEQGRLLRFVQRSMDADCDSVECLKCGFVGFNRGFVITYNEAHSSTSDELDAVEASHI